MQSNPTTITLDTGAIDKKVTLPDATRHNLKYCVSSVVARERGEEVVTELLENSPIDAEAGVWGESEWNSSVWANAVDEQILEKVLRIVSNNAFPKPNARGSLSPGQKHQLRDAMILAAHVSSGRDIFVTTDQKAFVSREKRAALEQEFGISILTLEEFQSRHS